MRIAFLLALVGAALPDTSGTRGRDLRPVVVGWADGKWRAAELHPGQGTWTISEGLEAPAASYANASCNGTHLVVWGGRQTKFDGALLDLRSMRWRSLPEAPIVRRSFGTVILSEDRLAVWGGDDGRGTALGDGAILRLSTLTWEKMPDAPLSPRIRHAGAFIGSRLYLWGGHAGATQFNDGAVFDPATRSWKKLPEAPIGPRANHLAMATGGRLLVWGGSRGGGAATGDGAVFDPGLQTWRTLPDCPVAGRAYSGADAAGGKVFVWGGYFSRPVDTGAEFDLDRWEWRELPKCELAARYDPGVLSLGSKLFVWGGYAGSDRSLGKDGAVFDARTRSWTALPPLPFGTATWALRYTTR